MVERCMPSRFRTWLGHPEHTRWHIADCTGWVAHCRLHRHACATQCPRPQTSERGGPTACVSVNQTNCNTVVNFVDPIADSA